MNKCKLYMIVSIIILIISIGGSFAWYTWESTNNISASLGFCAPEISFIGGTTLNGEGLVPVTSRDNGLKKQIDVYLNKTCKEGDSGVMNLYMKLDVLPTSLRHETFMFEVVKDDVVIFSGNFKDKQEGQTIPLLTNRVITEDDSIYFIYVYIDGTRDNPINMSNKSFRFTVWGEGTGAIYKNNVITNPSTPSDSSSKFLNTEIARSSIQTLTIAEDNTVPDTVPKIQTKDISINEDGSIMLWYTDDDGDGKLDIYMGSENGVIETNINGQGMFAYLENVESLDLTNLDTSNITNMSSMFAGSKNLKEIKLSNFDTSNVTSMSGMFNGCSSLTNIDLSSFDTSKVTSMVSMFKNCTGLTSLDLSTFDTSSVTAIGGTWDGSGMFQGCSKLVSIDFSGWDTSNVTTMGYMFRDCVSLTNLDLTEFETSNLTSMLHMFSRCTSLTTLDVSDFDTSNVTNMDSTFYNCTSLTTLDVSNWNTAKAVRMLGMFYGCRSLSMLDVSNWNTSKVNNMAQMFWGCSSLTSLDLSSFNTSKVTTMQGMFENCSSLISLDLSNFDTSNVTEMGGRYWTVGGMFEDCSSLTTLDLSGWNTSKVVSMERMFFSCGKLTTIYVSEEWNTSSVTYANQMFNYCKSLVGGAGTAAYETNYKGITYAIIDGGVDSPGYLTLKTSL